MNLNLEIHVALTGSDSAKGSLAEPLRSINRAAQLACPGDTVVVHAGEYREWVRPARGGLSDQRRITYTAAPGENVVIKGSERIVGWEREESSVWRAVLDNGLFGDFNPYSETIEGDWLVRDANDPPKHLGDVYLNGRSFYEVAARADVTDPPRRTQVLDHWTGLTVPAHEPDQTRFVWYAEVEEHATTVWANFHDADPNESLVEVNVRRSVFYPEKHHRDWITVRGFEMAQAATPWAPPTADQPGLVGPNWAKGWVIEDNVIHDAKCSAISLGKESATGHNYATERDDKPGYQYQIESVFAARQIGWDKEHIGSHVVRRNTIFDCGQNGIVGHLGGVFSTIEDNHIYRIALKREFYGYEIAGIKLHAAIDTTIRHNRINDCSLAIWLDWQTQGTRVSRNLLYRNNRDLFVEVSHGPYLVDHNVFASLASLEVVCQGGAFVHNLVAGSVRLESVLDRSTPYHLAHSTQVAGYATIVGGDDRWIGNLFLGSNLDDAYKEGSSHHIMSAYGTEGYNSYPASIAEYRESMNLALVDHQRFHGVKQAVTVTSNAYAGGASPFRAERNALIVDRDAVATLIVIEESDKVYLKIDVPEAVRKPLLEPVSGRDLGRVRFPDVEFEESDGSPVMIDVDLIGSLREPGTRYPAGPLTNPPSATGRVRVW